MLVERARVRAMPENAFLFYKMWFLHDVVQFYKMSCELGFFVTNGVPYFHLTSNLTLRNVENGVIRTLSLSSI